MNDLERRIEKLERQLRLWQYLGMASLLVVGLFFFFAATTSQQSSQQEIEAKSITIGTPKGSIYLGPNKAGEPEIDLLDENGKIRTIIDLLNGEPGIFLGDGNGIARIMAYVRGGKSYIQLGDGNAKLRVSLGETGLLVGDENGNQRINISLIGEPNIALLDGNGKMRLSMGIFKKNPLIVLWDEYGKTLGGLP